MAGTVADVMVATLKASGVRRVYGIPGDSLNGFTDALRRDGASRLAAGYRRGCRWSAQSRTRSTPCCR
ncbi:thiamine pyrophosphate-binding protein [Pseudofrankia sp. BMG5.37]|uniref:thiamine pyrophosphate-binding protein n=1 Tax=Pseudofrankia sp. BMG5.36 TaxID=1834512 RepID=UPI0009F699FC|nr:MULTISPECIES: thiamine pyrophosphate-binding protein [unclassified Pseudofrankia]MDT3445360.1 thiamine pyrophosphate-binding protein [Pseudofrankia sp. BMG5.37]